MAKAAWSPANAWSFLTLLTRVCVHFPGGTAKGVDRFMVMCIAWEESRFRNIVQIGLEARAARYDSGTLRPDEIKPPLDAKGNQPAPLAEGVAVGFTQVQLRQFDKQEVVSSLGRDWKTLKFRDVTSNNEFAAAFGTRYLYMKGIQGQTSGHPLKATFQREWPKAAKALREAMAAKDVQAMKVALNTAIIDAANRMPLDQADVWDFIFPPDEVATLQSDDWMRFLGLMPS